MTLTPVFLCGMPRSTSTWLGQSLDTHPEGTEFGESDYWGRSYVEPTASGFYDASRINKVTEIQAQKEWSVTTGDENGDLNGFGRGAYGPNVLSAAADVSPPIIPLGMYTSIRTTIGRHRRAEILIDKTPGHVLFHRRILAASPDSQFLVIHREPFGFVGSLTHRKEDRELQDWRLLWRLAYHPALTVLRWRANARAILGLKATDSVLILIVDYANIVDQPDDVLDTICSHLRVNRQDVRLDVGRVASSFKDQRRQDPPAATGYWLRRSAFAEWKALFLGVVPPDCRGLDVVTSWLLLLPGMLAFLRYLPRPTRCLNYFATLLGIQPPTLPASPPT